MRKRVLLVVLVILLLFTSCDMDKQKKPKPHTLSDSRFNGTYTFYESREAWGHDDGYYWEQFKFNGTNYGKHSVYYYFWTGSSWSISDGWETDDVKIEINEDHTKFRITMVYNDNTGYEYWDAWYDYSFSEDGRHLYVQKPWTNRRDFER